MILVDSDHLSVLLNRRERRHAALFARLRATPDMAVPIIVVEEHLRGRLAQIRRLNDVHRQVGPYSNLASAIAFFQEWEIAHWSESAAYIFKRLRKEGVRIGTQDLKIGSLALAHNATLLSSNLRDFEQIPGLRVEDWPR